MREVINTFVDITCGLCGKKLNIKIGGYKIIAVEVDGEILDDIVCVNC